MTRILLLAAVLLTAGAGKPATRPGRPPTLVEQVADLRAEVRELKAELAELKAALADVAKAPAAGKAPMADNARIKAAVAANEIVVGMTDDQVMNVLEKIRQKTDPSSYHPNPEKEQRMVGGKIVTFEYWDGPIHPYKRIESESGLVVSVEKWE